ncbi:MAG: hypothetical protein II106_06180 [Oscillospiraceae bacterium]|nr:hypothetical protein [Oscillospiraceae bacterium]
MIRKLSAGAMAFCQPIYSSTGLVKSKAQFFLFFKKIRAGAAEARGGPFWTKNANFQTLPFTKRDECDKLLLNRYL